MTDFGSNPNSSTEGDSAGRDSGAQSWQTSGTGNDSLISTAKLLIPSWPEFLAAFPRAFEMTSSLARDARGTLEQIAGNASEPVSTQVRTLLLPLSLFSALVMIIDGAVIGQSLPFLGMWREPMLQSILYHTVFSVMTVGILVGTALVTKRLLKLGDSDSAVVAVITAPAAPVALGIPVVLIPYLGGLLLVATICFSLCLLCRSSQVLAGRNKATTAKVIVSLLVVGLIFVMLVVGLLSPLGPPEPSL